MYFSGGSGSPLTITLPYAISFTVTNDTSAINAVFVFKGVGTFLGGITGAAGSLGYTTNGASPLAINSTGNISLGAATTNDMVLFKMASPGVALNVVLGLSSGAATTTTNITAAAPPSGLYSAIFIDINGTQLGVGALAGDFDDDADVDGADFLKWQRGESPRGAGALDFADWKANFGAAVSATPASAAAPEPPTAVLLILGLAHPLRRRR
jgi:hypothetical protein